MKLILFLTALTAINCVFRPELSNEEFSSTYLGLHKNWFLDTTLTMFNTHKVTNEELPESFTWTEKMPECVHEIRN